MDTSNIVVSAYSKNIIGNKANVEDYFDSILRNPHCVAMYVIWISYDWLKIPVAFHDQL